MAVFLLPCVLMVKALYPIAVLIVPEVKASNAPIPTPTFFSALDNVPDVA